MVKIIKVFVYKCEQCPHYDSMTSLCYCPLQSKVFKVDPSTISDECPLETLELKGE